MHSTTMDSLRLKTFVSFAVVSLATLVTTISGLYTPVTIGNFNAIGRWLFIGNLIAQALLAAFAVYLSVTPRDSGWGDSFVQDETTRFFLIPCLVLTIIGDISVIGSFLFDPLSLAHGVLYVIGLFGVVLCGLFSNGLALITSFDWYENPRRAHPIRPDRYSHR